MTRWYIDIYPCNACVNGPFISSFAHCKKGHHVIHVEGCNQCGILVNAKWYFDKIPCTDFEYEAPDDPSGS